MTTWAWVRGNPDCMAFQTILCESLSAFGYVYMWPDSDILYLFYLYFIFYIYFIFILSLFHFFWWPDSDMVRHAPCACWSLSCALCTM